MGVFQEVGALVEPLKHVDPRIYQALELLNKQLQKLSADVEPLIRQSTIEGGGTSTIAPPGVFIATSAGATLRFNWTAVVGGAQYEIRKGTVWEFANFILRSSSLQADIDPVLYGTHTYLIKTIDVNGNYSSASTQVIFTLTQIPAPSISPQVIDNNVLLYWTEPVSTFNIDHYELLKDGVVRGIVTATFSTFFEAVAGTYTYSIIGYDVAGNASLEGSVAVDVNQPPDYGLQDSRVSALGGTRVNVLLSNSRLLASVATETWEQHFINGDL